MKLLIRFTVAMLAIIAASSPAQAQNPAQAVSAEEMKKLVDGNNEFAVDLYRELAKKPGNLFFSPFSISTSLAMVYAGARGETADELAKTLHFSLPHERLHPAFGRLFGKLPSGVQGANSLWGQRGSAISREFLDLARKDYGAEYHELDFVRDCPGASATINRWVVERTQGKIKELFSPTDLSAATRFVLANAVHFRGRWHVPFDKNETRLGEFNPEPGKRIQVHIMGIRHSKHEWTLYGSDGFWMLDLPYQGASEKQDVVLTILLPTHGFALGAVEKSLTAEVLRKAFSKPTKQRLDHIYLPRFKVQCAFPLRDTLLELGAKRIFSSDAELSGPAGALAEVVHKALLEVDENGADAAAATGGWRNAKFGSQFSASEPFLFFIRDRVSGSVFFAGRVAELPPVHEES